MKNIQVKNLLMSQSIIKIIKTKILIKIFIEQLILSAHNINTRVVNKPR